MKGSQALIAVLEENPNHVPAGSPAGGQFAKGGDGARIAAVQKWVAGGKGQKTETFADRLKGAKPMYREPSNRIANKNSPWTLVGKDGNMILNPKTHLAYFVGDKASAMKKLDMLRRTNGVK